MHKRFYHFSQVYNQDAPQESCPVLTVNSPQFAGIAAGLDFALSVQKTGHNNLSVQLENIMKIIGGKKCTTNFLKSTKGL